MEKVITTHLFNGDPLGIMNVFISNKICNMYVIPRSLIDEANNNTDIIIDQPSFYILLGGSEFTELPQAYIGHAESFKERVRSHKTPSAHGKKFWDRALVFVAGDNSLTKVDVAYIEAKLIEKAKLLNNYSTSENKVKPTPPSLPAHLRVIVNEFISDVELLTSFVGCTIFKDTLPNKPHDSELFFLKSRGGDAKAIYKNGKLTILAGSILASTSVPSLKKSRKNRDEMVKNLTEDINGQRVLKINKELSPSTAASLVSGTSMNGWICWKNENGEALDKYRGTDN